MNFGEWLTTERLWQVQDLLENTDLPIERIAEQSGFGSAANLRLQFKAKFKSIRMPGGKYLADSSR